MMFDIRFVVQLSILKTHLDLKELRPSDPLWEVPVRKEGLQFIVEPFQVCLARPWPTSP